MAMNALRIGTLTMRITAEQKATGVFYERLFSLCEQFMPGCGCQVVLLPERSGTRPEYRQPVGGSICRRFGDVARRHGLVLIAPLVESNDGKTFNTHVVLSLAGQVIHTYRKVHLAPGEETGTAEGDCFRAFDLPWFRAGVQICYDNHFPEPSRCLAVQGAQVLFWPAYGDLRNLARCATRCLDNNVYLVASGVVDMSCNLPAETFSRGMVMDPAGQVLAESPPEDSLVTADLPLDPKTKRLRLFVPKDDYLARRRPGSYRPLTEQERHARNNG
jgi:N-carbamoylputrescine amidase